MEPHEDPNNPDAEALQESEKSELMSTVAHQLRTPLSAIRFAMQTLSDTGLTEEQRRLVDTSEAAANRMGELVSQLFHLGTIEQTIGNPQLAAGSIEHLLDEITDQFALQLEEKHIQLTRNYALEPQLTHFDHSKLQEAVSNLIDNAKNYTPSGGQIVIETQYEEDCVHIRIMDSGVGIDTEDINRLFGKFSRLRKARQINPGGFGLGLYIAHKVVAAHNGVLAYTPNEPHGAVFTITLPLSGSE